MNGNSRLGALMAFPPPRHVWNRRKQSQRRNLACGPCFVRCALSPEEAGCILEKDVISGPNLHFSQPQKLLRLWKEKLPSIA
jgi:hypothetical protein